MSASLRPLNDVNKRIIFVTRPRAGRSGL